jgi:hypothetical protein
MEDNIESGGSTGGVKRTPEAVAQEKIQPLREKGVPDMTPGEMKKTGTIAEALHRIRRFLSSQQ